MSKKEKILRWRETVLKKEVCVNLIYIEASLVNMIYIEASL